MENANTIDNIYTIISPLGQGGISFVYLVKKNNIEYAAKIRIRRVNGFQQELQMTALASGLNNPHLIHLNNHGIGRIEHNGMVAENKQYLILDYYPKGNLFKYIEQGPFTERQAKYIFKKILQGVQALHGAGVCHRNLKLEAILLDQNFNPKISNFAFAKRFIENNQVVQLTERVGTLNYMPPQMYNNQPYSGEKADIFSLGVILFNLVTGVNGFKTSTNNDYHYKSIMDGKINLYWEKVAYSLKNANNLSLDFKNLYISMVAFNENVRPPNIAQILQHHWFNEINILNNQQLIDLENNVRNEFIAREPIVLQNIQMLVNDLDF